jgi:hypothetical protein
MIVGGEFFDLGAGFDGELFREDRLRSGPLGVDIED